MGKRLPANLQFSAPSAELEKAFARYEAARQLMLGLAAAVEQRTLKTGPDRVKEGVAKDAGAKELKKKKKKLGII